MIIQAPPSAENSLAKPPTHRDSCDNVPQEVLPAYSLVSPTSEPSQNAPTQHTHVEHGQTNEKDRVVHEGKDNLTSAIQPGPPKPSEKQVQKPSQRHCCCFASEPRLTARDPLNPPPPAFVRPVAPPTLTSCTYSPFSAFVLLSKSDFLVDGFRFAPNAALQDHDIEQSDMHRFLEDLQIVSSLSNKEKVISIALPAGMGLLWPVMTNVIRKKMKKSNSKERAVVDLVEVWQEKAWGPRGLRVSLWKGRTRLSGTFLGDFEGRMTKFGSEPGSPEFVHSAPEGAGGIRRTKSSSSTSSSSSSSSASSASQPSLSPTGTQQLDRQARRDAKREARRERKEARRERRRERKKERKEKRDEKREDKQVRGYKLLVEHLGSPRQ